MNAVLQFIYTDRVEDIASCTEETLIAADMFDFDVLKDKCEQVLIMKQRKVCCLILSIFTVYIVFFTVAVFGRVLSVLYHR